MSMFKSRVKRLEDQRRRRLPPGQTHFTSAVRVPPEIPHEAWRQWVAEQPCACGRVACPERRIGLLVPTPCQTAEEWRRYYAPR
jgi:hypothetical protein